MYSSFQYPKGPGSFKRAERFKETSLTEIPSSPGPGAYEPEPSKRELSGKRSSVGPATFYKSKRESSLEDMSRSPGVGQYTPKYHLIS